MARSGAAARRRGRCRQGWRTQRLRSDPETALAMSNTHQTRPVRKMTPTIRRSRTFTAGTYRPRQGRPDGAGSVMPGAVALVSQGRVVPAVARSANGCQTAALDQVVHPQRARGQHVALGVVEVHLRAAQGTSLT